MSKSTLLCIVGPTACHKTEVSILLAKAMDGEIISADSVQVYTGMDIGSAKPTERERMGIPHHMIDCVPIDTPSFSVVQYRSMAAQAIEGVISRGKRPIVVGGSGLYVQALTSPLEFAIPSDPVMRAYWNSVYEASPEDAVEQLAKCEWVDEGKNLLITGPTSGGKSYLANAMCVAALRQFKTVRYVKASRLMGELEKAREESSYIDYLAKSAKLDLLVIDDFGFMDLDLDKCRDLFEVIDIRDGRR
ncbi:MAG: ATP-binding protein, partial [Clostridia bacterium]